MLLSGMTLLQRQTNTSWCNSPGAFHQEDRRMINFQAISRYKQQAHFRA
jgi:hypothetical protein